MAKEGNNSVSAATPGGKGESMLDLASVIETARMQPASVADTTHQPIVAGVDSGTSAPAANFTPPDIEKSSGSRHVPRRWIFRGSFVIVVIALLGAGYLLMAKHHRDASLAKSNAVSGAYSVTKTPLQEIALENSKLPVTTDRSATLTTNGALDVNGSLVIGASGQPTNPVKGQLYFNRTDNKLYFYNGIRFIDITHASVGSTSNVVGSVQGQTGDVNYSSGPGISITGSTISNSGITALTSGNDKLAISSNGDGTYTVTYTEAVGSSLSLQPTSPGSAQTGDVNITGTMIASTFKGSLNGNGSGLTALSTTQFIGGTVPDSRLSTNVTVQGNTFNSANQLVKLTAAGFLPAVKATNLTGLSTTQFINGTIPDANLSTNVTLQGNTFNSANKLVKLDGTGLLPAISAINLTNLNVSNVTNSGTLSDSRLSTNVTLQGNTFNGANQLLKLNGSGMFSALNGSNISNFVGSSFAGPGNLSDARLSSNVALLNANQTWTGLNTFLTQALGVNTITPTAGLSIGDAGQSFTLQGNGSSTLTSTNGGSKVTLGFSGIQTANIRYNFDNSTPANSYTICWTSLDNSTGNCAGTGNGVTTSGGTVNQLALFTGSQGVGNSSVSDNGVTVTAQAAGNSGNAFQIQNANYLTSPTNLFVADTANTRIGIGTATPGYTLDANGSVNSATGFRVGGNLVCISGGCSASSSSGFYIQNGTVQQTANFNTQPGDGTTVGGIIKGATGQTADLFQLKQGAVTVAKFTPGGSIDITGNYKLNGSAIASSNLSDTANLARLNATQTFSGNNTFTKLVIQQSSGVPAFQIQNANYLTSPTNLFMAYTTTSRIGIGTATPGYTLDVNGDINVGAGGSYRINGVAICGTSASCAPSAGSAFYLQNGTTQQTSTNFNIQSNNVGAVTAIIRGKNTGQTADLLQLQDAGGNNVATVGNEGLVSLGQTGTTTGTIAFKHTTGSGTVNLTPANPGSSAYTLTLPAETGTLCSTGSICSGYAAGTGNAVGQSAFLQGGNTFGAAADLGTNDSNALAFRTNGQARLTLSATTGNLRVGQDTVIGAATNGGGGGYGLTLQSGTGTTAGGDTSVVGGTATNASINGGNVLIYGGAAGSGGTQGSVNIGTGTAGTIGTTNIESGTGTVNLGAAATSAHVLNVGTSAAAIQTLNLGSQYSTSSTTIQGGSGGVAVQTAASSRAFQVNAPTEYSTGQNIINLYGGPCSFFCPGQGPATGNNYGYSFNVTSAGTVTSLGILDVPGGPYTVTLYRQIDSAVLASTSVTAVGTSAVARASITPVALAVGTTYVVSVYIPNASNYYYIVGNTVTMPFISIGGGLQNVDTGPSMPTLADCPFFCLIPGIPDITFHPTVGAGPLLTVDTTTNNVTVASNGLDGTITIGNTTSAAAQTINVGTNSTSGSTTNVNIGTLGNVNIQGTTTASIQSNNTGSINIGSTSTGGTTTISSSSSVSVQTADGGTINVGNTANNFVTIGSTSMVASTITIGGVNQTGTITLGQSTATQIINIGSGAVAATKTGTINIASNNDCSGGADCGGSLNVNILSGVGTLGAGALKMANNPRVTTIDLGNVAPDNARTITIAGLGSNVSDTINIGTGSATTTGSKVIHIGDGTPTSGGGNVITIGSTTTSSWTQINGGATGSIAVRGSSVTGFSVQNSAGTSNYLTVDNASGVVKVATSCTSSCSYGASEQFTVNDPAATDPSNPVAALISAGSSTSKGLVVQGVASQLANLQEWQSSAGTILASISSAGTLTAQSATFSGTLTANGHIISANSSGTTSIVVGAGAGTGATASISGNDTAGVITIVTGSAPTAGTLGTITFGSTFGTAPTVVITPKDVPSGSIYPQYQVANASATTFNLNSFNALTATNKTYTFSYYVIK
jgi:hypothetical protein